MGKYFAFFKVNLQNAFAYRGPMVVWMISGILSLIGITAVWLSSTGGNTLGGYTRPELINYYIIGFLVSQFAGWYSFENIQGDIREGRITNILVRPLSYLGVGISNELSWHIINLAVSISGAIILFPLIGIFPVSIASINLIAPFALAVLIMSMTIMLFCYCIGLLSFWFSEVHVIYYTIFWGVQSLIGGQGIPMSFIPQGIREIVNFLPYRYMYSFPLEIYFQKISTMEMYSGLAIGIFWIIFLFSIYKYLLNKGLKNYSGYGQ